MSPRYDRLFVKMVRDKTRKSLVKGDNCWVSGAESSLEIHHMYTLSSLVNDYLVNNNIFIDDTNKIQVREDFITSNYSEMHEQVVLHKSIHKKLHSIFGTKYQNHIVPKVRLWLERQKDKYEQLGS